MLSRLLHWVWSGTPRCAQCGGRPDPWMPTLHKQEFCSVECLRQHVEMTYWGFITPAPPIIPRQRRG